MGERDVGEFLQMCDAPSDAYSAGEWCEAAGALAARLAAVETERDEHIAIELKLSDALNARDEELAALRAERDEARQARDTIRELAQRARAVAASPDYDEERIQDVLWAVVDAALAPVAARPETDV